MRNITDLIASGHEVSYKLLSIGMFKYDGTKYIQVHCDRRDLEFSNMYHMSQIRQAVTKYLELSNKYIASEIKFGSFPPIVNGQQNVPK